MLCHCPNSSNEFIKFLTSHKLFERLMNYIASVRAGTWQHTHPRGYDCRRKECMHAWRLLVSVFIKLLQVCLASTLRSFDLA